MKKHSTLDLMEALDCLWTMHKETKRFSRVDKLLTDARVKIQIEIVKTDSEICFRKWLASDQILKTGKDEYKTQCTLFSCKFTLKELRDFFIKTYYLTPNF